MTREAWTDERMDDLVKHMDNGFQLAREESRELREDMRETRREMKAGFERIDAKFEKVDAKFDSLYRLMIGAMVTFLLSFILTQI